MIKELLCIDTHPTGMVKAGNTYPLIDEKKFCSCIVVNIGLKIINTHIHCSKCNKYLPKDGIGWVYKSRFIEIGDVDELEEVKEEVNINVLNI